MKRDKVTDVLEDVGAVVLANACGPCIGQVCAEFSINLLIIHVEYNCSGKGTRKRERKMVTSLLFTPFLRTTNP